MDQLPDFEIVDNGRTKYILLKVPDVITKSVRAKGAYDAATPYLAKVLLSREASGTVLDIGANIGTFAIPLAQELANFRFTCFEPQPVVYYQLCANIVLNRLANVRAHNRAVGARCEDLRITLPDYAVETNIGAFSLDPDVRANAYECATVGAEETVAVVTLDSLNLSDVRLIKIDVEGLELDVLKGAAATLAANNYPPLICEVWNWKPWFAEKRRELVEFVTRAGYETYESLNTLVLQHPKRAIPVKFVAQ